MKFTKKNLRVIDMSVFDCKGRRTESYFNIIISTESRKETTKIRDEILSNQEKAKKYDLIIDESLILNHDLSEENKRLKADIKKREKVANILQHDLVHLREKINKIQELADGTDFLVTKRQLEEVLKGVS